MLRNSEWLRYTRMIPSVSALVSMLLWLAGICRSSCTCISHRQHTVLLCKCSCNFYQHNRMECGNSTHGHACLDRPLDKCIRFHFSLGLLQRIVTKAYDLHVITYPIFLVAKRHQGKCVDFGKTCARIIVFTCTS